MKPITIAALSACMLLAACNEDEKTVYVDNYPQVVMPVEIAFRAVAGDTAIDCDAALSNLGTTNATGKIADFRFFVHNVRLVLDNGDEVPVELNETAMQTDNIAMLDFRNRLDNCNVAGAANPNINKKLLGKITLGEGMTGTIKKIAFTLGVPFSHNHASQTDAVGPLKNPGIASGMAWSWQGGYKFTGLDFIPVTPIQQFDSAGLPTTTASRWNTHLGSTGCAVTTADLGLGIPATPCANPNRVDVVLDGFSFSKAVQLDYAELLSNSDLSEDHGGPVGCMSGGTDPECNQVFTQLGLVHALSGLDPLSPPAQAVFTLVDM